MRWIWGLLVLIAAVVSLSWRATASATLRVYPASALAGETVVLLLPDGVPIPPNGVFGAGQASASQYPYAVNVPLGPCLNADRRFLQALAISFAPESCRTLLVPGNAWGGPQTVSVAGLSVTLNVYGQSVVANQKLPVAPGVSRTASFFLWVDASFKPELIDRVLAQQSWTWRGVIRPFTKPEALTTDTKHPSKTCRGRVQGFTMSDNNNRLGRAIAELTMALRNEGNFSEKDVSAVTASDPLPGYAVPTVGVTTVANSVPIDARTKVGFTNTPNSGAGVTIAVLDTGFGKANAGRSVNTFDVMQYKPINTLWNNAETSWTDEFSANPPGGNIRAHGTAVASFAAGTKFGLAPAARVLSVKVCDAGGLCELPRLWHGTCEALRYREAKPMVLNLSLGGDTPSSIERRILVDALKLNPSVDVVASSGNGWLLTANNRYMGQLQHFPAAESVSLPIFAVGAVGLESAGDKVWKLGDFSNQGAHVNLLAPGLKVLGIDGCLGLNSLCDKYSGTSFAAPLVSGALARLRSGVAINWTPEDLQQKLLEAQRRPGCPSVGVGYPSGATATIPVLNLSAGCLP